jgi:sodium/bile acid cotransporter 7
MAGGNVPAAVCAASVSNLLGVIVTPLLAGALIHTNGGGFDGQAIIDIGMQLLLPFIVGQVLRPLIGNWIKRHGMLTRVVDRGSILLIVYSAFSAGVVAGIWSQVEPWELAIMVVADIVMLAIIMVGTVVVGRATKIPYADAIVLLFCGSKKSLASGLPMANILFAGRSIGLIVLPIMIFHQIQLFVCAVIAQRSAYRNALAAE